MNIESVPFMTIFDMPVDEVKTAPFNPPVRTEEYTLKDLLNSIRELGVLDPIKVSRDGMIGDGHRRLKCAKIIGLQTVPARRYDLSVEELWALNFTGRPSTPKETMSAVAHGMPELYIPRRRRGAIDKIKAIVGEDGLRRLDEMHVSSHAITIAQRVANYCDNDDNEFLRKTLWWMVENDQQQMAKRAMDAGIDPAVLESAILNNRKLAYAWDVI